MGELEAAVDRNRCGKERNCERLQFISKSTDLLFDGIKNEKVRLALENETRSMIK